MLLLSLLERFADTTVLLGVIAIASSQLESVEDIGARLTAALRHIDRERLVAAPDCGLTMLDRELAMVSGMELTILPAGLPYARAIAAQFDAYRAQQVRQFSSAI